MSRRKAAKARSALPSLRLTVSTLSVPVRTPDTQLPLREIDIAPLERDHLAAPQPGLSAQQHDQVRPMIDCPCRTSTSRFILEVVERAAAPLLVGGSSLIFTASARSRPTHTAFFSRMLSTARMLNTVFGDWISERALSTAASSLLIASTCLRPNAGIRYV